MTNNQSDGRDKKTVWARIIAALQTCRRIAVTSHVLPDGDAVGSVVGTTHWLRLRGLACDAFLPGTIPARLASLDTVGVRQVGPNGDVDRLSGYDGLVILDLNAWGRLGPLEPWAKTFDGVRVLIDHHPGGDADLAHAELSIRDTDAAATALIVAEGIELLGESELFGACATDVRRLATALAAGILSDTGWLSHSNTSPHVLETLCRLSKHGVDLPAIRREIYGRNTANQVRDAADIVRSAFFSPDGRLAVGLAASRDDDGKPIDPDGVALALAQLASVGSVELVVMCHEVEPGVTRVSLRSRSIDCQALAERFGGGGHRAAAGMTIRGDFESVAENVIQAARIAVQGSSESRRDGT